MGEVVSALYLPLCDRVTSALAHESQVTPGSEDERELNELKKSYYYFLASVCEHKLLPVLVTPGKSRPLARTALTATQRTCRASNRCSSGCSQGARTGLNPRYVAAVPSPLRY